MGTKKFNTFEYAGDTFTGDPGLKGLHRQEAFDSPYGHVFVIAAGEAAGSDQPELVDVVIERIRYYFTNETDDKASEATKNALVYTSGYLYQLSKKYPRPGVDRIHCLCVLFHDEKIYYSTTGRLCLSVFDGRKVVPFLTEGYGDQSGGSKPFGEEGTVSSYMGQKPLTDDIDVVGPVEPADEDILLMGSGSVCRWFQSRQAKKLLHDPMPLQAKVSRLLRYASDEVQGTPAAAMMMVCFYNLKNKRTAAVAEEQPVQPKGTVKTYAGGGMPDNVFSKLIETIKGNNLLKIVLLAIVSVIVGYMFYDLFIYDPHPAVPVSRIQEETEDQLVAEEDVLAGEEIVFPDDVEYVVRSGDTWRRIYRQFGVCSYFIINHPPNEGRFGSDGGLIAGRRLEIPVKYSARSELNPVYYTFFTLDKVGGSCEHASREFIADFKESVGLRE